MNSETGSFRDGQTQDRPKITRLPNAGPRQMAESAARGMLYGNMGRRVARLLHEFDWTDETARAIGGQTVYVNKLGSKTSIGHCEGKLESLDEL